MIFQGQALDSKPHANMLSWHVVEAQRQTPQLGDCAALQTSVVTDDLS